MNDEIITRHEMEKIYEEAGLGPKDKELRKAELRKKAVQLLFLQEAERRNVEVDDKTVEKAVQKDIKNFKSEDAFHRWLQRRGMSRARYEDEKRLQLIFQKLFSLKYHEWLRDEKTKTPPIHEFVTPAEMRDYYENHREEFHVPESVALVRLTIPYQNSKERDKAVRRLESVLRRVKEGTRFEFLAQMHTPENIEIAVRRLERENTLFSSEVTSKIFDDLEAGQVSDVLEEPGAVHLVKVIEKTEAENQDFEEAQPRIRTILEYQKRKKNEDILLQEMLRHTYYWPPDLFE